ncbi:MAG: response regulator [Oscillospiraceae bacterium]|nr:response regulator [Oscillospiraceae bacterium]
MDKSRRKIILVDDNIPNIDQGRNMLKTFYEVYPAPSAAKLFEILDNVIPDLILLDIEMPEMNGYEAIKILKADERFADIPVIFLTSKEDDESQTEGFNLGAADYITKPFSGSILLKRIANQLLIMQQKSSLIEAHEKLQDYADNLEKRVSEQTAEVMSLQNAIISIVADLVEFRDKLARGHIARTQLYLQALCNEMLRHGDYYDEISKWNLEMYLAASQLHDVGKIAVPDTILNKPSRLTPEEYEIVKTHVTVGVDAIEQIINKTGEHAFLERALVIAGTHHEKWDGSGYPIGFRSLGIPLEGRLMAIADVYDALVSERPYKKALSHDEACSIIAEEAGFHFDPVLVAVFDRISDQFIRIGESRE